MSVVIRKREEKRDTPFYTFLAYAAIPLLLMFVGGLVLGRTQAEDANHWEELYRIATDQVDSLQQRERFLAQLITTSDSLRLAFRQGCDKLEDEIVMLYAGGNATAGLWERDKARFMEEWKRNIGRLQGEHIAGSPLGHLAQRQIDLLEAYFDSQNLRLNQRRISEMRKAELTNEEIVNAQIEQLQQEKNDLQAQLQQCQLKVLIEQQKCIMQGQPDESVKLQLAEAQAKLIFHKELATSIGTHINEIRTGIIPEIEGRRINLTPSNVDRLRSALSEQITSIDQITLKIAE